MEKEPRPQTIVTRVNPATHERIKAIADVMNTTFPETIDFLVTPMLDAIEAKPEIREALNRYAEAQAILHAIRSDLGTIAVDATRANRSQ